MTASRTLPLPLLAAVHEHGWTAESAHPTSQGEVVYVRCATCGARRVDVRGAPDLPPSAQSRPVSAARR
ncbi:hypothetical protein [Microbacterium sp.]|uniref:hypothetical protein n=1 Tax=Microbacterium sp. TaxID=51671 RepID=UPI0028A8A45D|nr:hypothetical protein [Microbacterium sp.]